MLSYQSVVSDRKRRTLTAALPGGYRKFYVLTFEQFPCHQPPPIFAQLYSIAEHELRRLLLLLYI